MSNRIEYLPPEIANEGTHAAAPIPGAYVDDDDEREFQPEIERPHIPDYKGIKSIKQYFPEFTNQPYRPKPWPAYFYHAQHGTKLVRNEDEAKRLGVTWDRATRKHVCSGEWKAEPIVRPKPSATAHGKWITKAGETAASTAETIAAVISAVMDKIQGRSVATDDKDWAEFQKFRAFQQNQASAPTVTAPVEAKESALRQEPDEKQILIDLAAEKGIKLKASWSLDRIKAELDKAA